MPKDKGFWGNAWDYLHRKGVWAEADMRLARHLQELEYRQLIELEKRRRSGARRSGRRGGASDAW